VIVDEMAPPFLTTTGVPSVPEVGGAHGDPFAFSVQLIVLEFPESPFRAAVTVIGAPFVKAELNF
jgi:hypothetical protein